MRGSTSGREVTRLRGLVEQYDKNVRWLFRTRRWKLGNRLADLLLALRGRRRGRGPIDALLELSEKWAAEKSDYGDLPASGSASSGGNSFAEDERQRDAEYRREIRLAETREEQSLPGDARPSVPLTVLIEDDGSGAVETAVECAGRCADAVRTVSFGLRAALEAFPDNGYVAVLRSGDRPADLLRKRLSAYLSSFPRGRNLPAAIVMDEDRVDENGERCSPMLKPGFNRDFLVEYDYLKRGVLFDAARARDAGREAADHRELVLALADNGHAIGKMPGIGLHCELRADDEPYPYHGKGSTRAFLERHLAREKGLSIVETPIGPRPRFRDASGPLASIIIPFRDRSDLLEMCVNAIFQITVYPNYEILLVDNDSRETATAELLRRFEKDPRVRVLRARGAFHYSRINNRAAADAKGAVLVFMNNDVRVLADRWLDEIVGQTARSGVGCVGGKLLHDDGSIQHAGVVVGLFGGLAGHLFARRQEPFVPPAWLRYTRETTAVTAALMGVRAETFRAVGGFDETFEMTGNDVDLCLRLRARGFRNLWVPDVVAFHLEKQSRKEIPVRKNDVKRSQEAYRPYLQEGDPFYPRLASLAKGDLSPGVGGERGGGGAPAVPVSGRAERAAEIGVPARPAAPVSEERGFLAAYDARPEALETNRRLLDRFRNERHVKAGVVSWFVPAFDHAYRGGIHTALRIADHLSRHEGSLNRFVVFGGKPLDPGVARQVREAFPELRFELLQPGPGGEIPPSDVGICTLWTTAYHLLRYDRCCGKFYLVQDFEPAFYAGGSLYGLVEETYRFGYWGLCNTPGVREAYAAYGSPAMYFVPGIDRSIHRPGKPREPEPVRIVFYARPSKARNAFELGLAAFRALKQEYGRRIEILCVGEDFAPSAHDAAGIVRVPGLLPDMEAVADLYRTCDIGVVFMFSRHPSYQPFEYMACGCATVTNQNEANAWFFRDGENALLTAPTVSAVVSAIRRLIEDRALRRRIVEGGLRTTAALDWDRELDRIRRYILTGEE